MRAVVQGVDARKAWNQYLKAEGERDDLRRMKSAIAQIRTEFAAAARREGKPGTARLVLIDASVELVPAKLPTLEEFARERGMEDFSEAEQAEAYENTYSTATRRASRRAQLVRRQLDALRWLEDLVAQDPKPGDGVIAWLTPSLAERIESAGMPTLFSLIERINGEGARWWRGLPGIGAEKAKRIMDWLIAHEEAIGMPIAPHARTERMKLQPAELDAVVSPATGLVPMEKFIVPSDLDGSVGLYRSPALCILGAKNDYDAIKIWLGSKRRDQAAGESSTERAYRKEAERLLLWSILVRKKALSSLNVEDAIEYTRFLQAPPAEWCGPRHHQRWSPNWRPFEGPLKAGAMRHALIILRSLFDFLVKQNYMTGNPFSAIALPADSVLGVGKVLSFSQWDFIAAQLGKEPDNAIARRRDRAIRWLYATGLRLSEVVDARCSHLTEETFPTPEGKTVKGWFLKVVGKGRKARRVPVPKHLVAELQDEFAQMGRSRSVKHATNADVAILTRFDKNNNPLAWSKSGLAKAIRAFMKSCALQLNEEDAQAVMRATTHWLRHTHATHSLVGRKGRPAMHLIEVRDNLGHKSIATTSQYLRSDELGRLIAVEALYGQSDHEPEGSSAAGAGTTPAT